MAITHYLTVQTCKRVFFEPDYGVMRSTEPLVLDPELVMQPLCLFGVSVDNLPLKYTEYYHKNTPSISLSSFLKRFWDRVYQVNGFNNPIITGMPEVLVIDHRAKDLINDNFYSWLTENNIQYKFSDSKARTAIAKFRQHQDYPHTGLFEILSEDNTYAAPNEKYALSVEVLNRQENLSQSLYPINKHLSTIQKYFRNIEKVRFATAPQLEDINLVHIAPLESKADRQLEAAFWVCANLEEGSFGYLHNRKPQDVADSSRYEKKALLAALKSLPETQWENLFTSVQLEAINEIKKQRFKDTICVDESTFMDICWKLGLLDESITTLAFNVSRLNRSDMMELWNMYSHGGDVEFSCEIFLTPWQKVRSKKTYRFFFLKACGNSSSIFFICESNSAAAKAFDNDDCINHMAGNKFTTLEISDRIHLDYFDELLLHNRQYLEYISSVVRSFHYQGASPEPLI